ncbi:MAG: hypothetical protein KF775_08370 [Cyclobacteriaceae bacterium]|nr:hypothetical protein [Cyclobacteriaceae bacterium]
MKIKLLLGALLVCASVANAQQLELEKTFKISRASKRGFLAGLDYDPAAKTYSLTYFTDQKKNTFKYEQYVFDNDFNLVSENEFTEEAEKMKKKFKWFKFKGEEYTVVGNTVENNMMGTLVLRKKKITYKYQFLMGGYNRKVEILDKVKPKTEDGNRFTGMNHAEDEMTGDLFILASVKAKIGTKGNEDVGAIKLLKFDTDLNLVKTADFDFPYLQTLVTAQTLSRENPEDPESPGIAGMAFIFAPSNAMGKKFSDPDNNNFTYIRVDDQCNIVERFSFTSPASYWRVDDMLVNNNDFYFYGPAMAGRDKYFNEGAGSRIGGGEVKYKAVQLMKVSGGKLAYLTETNLDEFKAKQKFPPSQRKTPDYTGREFGIRSYNFTSTGDLVILGQNYDKSKDGIITKFEDVLGFHFDSKGVLKAQYGIDTKEKGITVDYNYLSGIGYTTVTKITTVYACPQTIIEGSDKNLYWVLQEIKGQANGKLLTYPRIGKVNQNNATLSDLTTFGKGEGFYLDPKYPFLETDKSETVVFFGADKAGKELWFARVKLK